MDALPLQIGSNTPAEDRVRANTSPFVNQDLDDALESRIRYYATQEPVVINRRIAELDREWDIERALEANAASVSIAGFVLGIGFGKKWLLLPVVAAGFLLNHAIKGWCPPLPILRRVGFRTRFEIEQERYALKILRGDFDHVEKVERAPTRDPASVLSAIQS
jgi:hypothetical protein